MDSVKNKEVLAKVGEGRTILETIRKRKKKLVRTLEAGNNLMNKALEGIFAGSKKRGKRRSSHDEKIS